MVLLTNGSRGATVLAARDEAFVEGRARRSSTRSEPATRSARMARGLGGRGLQREDLGDFDAVLRVAEFAVLVAARTCERAGAEPPRAAKVDAEWCFA